ncbi:hypothetical protein [Methylobacterium sp. NEAU K]|uniref:hypothetical protein n=1 Tax=Methylobacterium sp. NEAU K TaxID=3064946 RepID=UPI002734ED34|nr:hypothetical protein [Methylobacterium sp. NEAU K]MDP4004114.1 hypothetical protein [Methylobacterium sp. NEAU K]
MTGSLPDAFAATLAEAGPPQAWPAPLAALWWLSRDAPGPDEPAWERAHALVQAASGPDAAWVHAHLHRIEGDAGNARYWYERAGRAVPSDTPSEERAAIIAALWDPA